MERVSVRSANPAKVPIIIVAPHGSDDPYTALIAEKVAAIIDSYCVVNHGWERGDTYDYDRGIANCNNIEHLLEDVVQEEFLEPLLDYVYSIQTCMLSTHIFILRCLNVETP